MKRFFQFVAMMLVMSLVLSIPVFAAEPKSSAFFYRTGTYLEKVSGTTFDVWFDVTATGIMDELGVSTIKVQRSSDQTNWSTMYTFSKDSYSQMIDENTVRHADSVRYTGTTGYYYRAKVTFYAKNSSGTGTYVMYTDTIKVP